MVARDLGMTVGAMESEMTALEWEHWKILYNRENEDRRQK